MNGRANLYKHGLMRIIKHLVFFFQVYLLPAPLWQSLECQLWILYWKLCPLPMHSYNLDPFRNNYELKFSHETSTFQNNTSNKIKIHLPEDQTHKILKV